MGSHLSFLHGGECAARIAAYDWASTSLGPTSGWPASLRATVANMLHTRQPMLLFWGPELIQLYNDAFVPSFGVGKHPAALGQPARACWEDAWPVIGAQIEAVMAEGVPAWHEDTLVPIERNGRMEEVFWTYSYSPAFDDEGVIQGTLVIVTEVTGRVLAARRLDALARLGLALASATSHADALDALEAMAEAQRADVSFLVVRDAGGMRALGIEPPGAESLLASLPDGGNGVIQLSVPVAGRTWPEPVHAVFVVAAPPGGRPASIVFGLSPRLPADDGYRSYLAQAAAEVASTTRRIGQAEAAAAILRQRDDLLLHAPVATALIAGPDHVFVLANPLFCRLVQREPQGKSSRAAFPELEGTQIPAVLDRVYQTGEPFTGHELRVPLARAADGVLEHRYFNFNLEAVREPTGVVVGMMVVAVEITDQVLARHALERIDAERTLAMEALREANRTKDDFLAMLGHELRNPLAPAITALEILNRKDVSSATARERALIERHLRHVVRLVDDLLDVSRAASGALKLHLRALDLADVATVALEAALSLEESKKHRLEIELAPALNIDADDARITQVITNLVINAAKYTPAGGSILVRTSRDGDHALLEVSDTGVGVAPETLEKIFEPFAQGQGGADATQGGLGVGLSLVKSIVALHGGQVGAESAGVGRGSRFTVRLPLSAGPLPAAVAPRRRPQLESPLRILVVDDNVDGGEILGELLTLHGHVVHVANAPSLALEAVSAFEPDVALLDVGMPEMDGFVLGSLIRSRWPACQVLLITGYGDPRLADRALRLGFAGLLVKPVGVDHIFAMLAQE